MRQRAATTQTTLPHQLLDATAVAALLGIPERTFREGAGVLRQLRDSAVKLGKHHRWQYGFVVEWIAAQQREAIAKAQALQQARTAKQGELYDFATRRRRTAASVEVDCFELARQQKARRAQRKNRKGITV